MPPTPGFGDGTISTATLRQTTWALFGLMLCLSFSSSSYGVIIPNLIDEYAVSLSQAGAVTTVRGLGGLIALIIGTVLMDRLGKGFTLYSSVALFAAGLLAITVAPVYSIVLFGFLLFGGGSSLLDATINASIADLHAANRRQYIGMLYGVFSVGALLGPATIGGALAVGATWQTVFLGLTIVTMAATAYFYRTAHDVAEFGRRSRSTVKQPRNKQPLGPITMAALTISIYYGSQITTIAWMPLYFTSILQANPLLSGLSITLFWAGIGFGRSQMGRLANMMGELRLIQLTALLSTPIMIGTLLFSSPWISLVFLLLTGVLSGPIYPACMNYAFALYPTGTGKAASVMTISATFTGLAMPYLAGLGAEHWGLGTALWLIPILLLLSGLLSLALPPVPEADAPVPGTGT